MSSLANFLLAKRPKPKKKVTNGDMLRALAASQRDNTGVQLAIVEAKKSLALDAVCDSEVVIGAILKAHAATAVVKMIDNSEGALARHAEAELKADLHKTLADAAKKLADAEKIKAELAANDKKAQEQQDVMNKEKLALIQCHTPAQPKSIMPDTDLDGTKSIVVATKNGEGAVLVHGVLPAAEHQKAQEELAALKAENAKLKATAVAAPDSPELELPEESKDETKDKTKDEIVAPQPADAKRKSTSGFSDLGDDAPATEAKQTKPLGAKNAVEEKVAAIEKKLNPKIES